MVVREKLHVERIHATLLCRSACDDLVHDSTTRRQVGECGRSRDARLRCGVDGHATTQRGSPRLGDRPVLARAVGLTDLVVGSGVLCGRPRWPTSPTSIPAESALLTITTAREQGASAVERRLADSQLPKAGKAHQKALLIDVRWGGQTEGLARTVNSTDIVLRETLHRRGSCYARRPACSAELRRGSQGRGSEKVRRRAAPPSQERRGRPSEGPCRRVSAPGSGKRAESLAATSPLS